MSAPSNASSNAPPMTPRRGDVVALLTKPTGYCSQHYNLTVGQRYEVLDIAGCCVVTTTDVAGETGMYNAERVQVVHRPQP